MGFAAYCCVKHALISLHPFETLKQGRLNSSYWLFSLLVVNLYRNLTTKLSAIFPCSGTGNYMGADNGNGVSEEKWLKPREQTRSARASLLVKSALLVQCCGSVFKVLLFKVKNILCSCGQCCPKHFPFQFLSFSFISSVCVCAYIFILFSLLAIL